MPSAYNMLMILIPDKQTYMYKEVLVIDYDDV